MTEPEVHSYVCSHIFMDIKPVLLVAREQGDWMFLCGESHPEDEAYHLVGIRHLIERDPSLRTVLLLPDNTEAERESVGGAWRTSPLAEA